MSTNWKNKKDIQKAFDELLTPLSYKEKIKDDALLIMARFLSEVEKKYKEKGWRRKDLAKAIGTSPSYITQLFRGTKIINLETIAKFQDVLNIKFYVSSFDLDEKGEIVLEKATHLSKMIIEREGMWFYKPFPMQDKETGINNEFSVEETNLQIVA